MLRIVPLGLLLLFVSATALAGQRTKSGRLRSAEVLAARDRTRIAIGKGSHYVSRKRSELLGQLRADPSATKDVVFQAKDEVLRDMALVIGKYVGKRPSEIARESRRYDRAVEKARRKVARTAASRR